MRTRLGVVAAVLALALATFAAPAQSTAAGPAVRPSDISLRSNVHQLITVTSSQWSATRATLYAWRKRADGWHKVRGPVTVRLGWNGFVRASQRKQGSGTTPAGKFALPRAFGNRADPGTRLRYRHVDSNDVWPYEPRDPATYNILQPFQASSSHWRKDFRERLASYGAEYAYAVVIGFNLPRGVHWSNEAAPARRDPSRQHPPRWRDLPARAGQPLHRRLRRRPVEPGAVVDPLARPGAAAAHRDRAVLLGEEEPVALSGVWCI